jgi:hypothetical protein
MSDEFIVGALSISPAVSLRVQAHFQKKRSKIAERYASASAQAARAGNRAATLDGRQPSKVPQPALTGRTRRSAQ